MKRILQPLFVLQSLSRPNVTCRAVKGRNLCTGMSKTPTLKPKSPSLAADSQNKVSKSSIFLTSKRVGNCVIGVPKSDSQNLAAKVKRFNRLTNQRKNSAFSISSIWAKSRNSILILDGLLGRSYRLIFSGIFTAIRHPSSILSFGRSAWSTVKHEAKHYWTGFKLLGVEMKTSSGLVSRKLSGHSLSRRERKQLVRTTGDVLRVIPLLFFLLVPFLEFALPLVLKLFPNLLPSTFEDKFKKEENMKKQLRLRIDIAEFLQDMVIEMGNKKQDVMNSQDLNAFIADIKKGKTLPEETLFKVSKMFNDELTIDTMSRNELVLLCRYMEIPFIGNDSMLRLQLRQKLNALRHDDRVIYFEGVGTLNLQELQQACQERGMRATGLPRESLNTQLKQWVDLSVTKDVPLSLLILSRAFIINDFGKKDVVKNAIRDAIGQFGDETTRMATMKVESLTEQKLEAIRMQNMLIEKEKREKRSEEKDVSKTIEKLVEVSCESAVAKETKDLDKVKRKQELFLASNALEKGRIEPERKVDFDVGENIDDVAEKLETVQADVENISSKVDVNGSDTIEVEAEKQDDEVKIVIDEKELRLRKRLDKLLNRLETDIQVADLQIGDKLHVLDLDRDGKVSTDELKSVLGSAFKEKLGEDQMTQIVQKLDVDNDGMINTRDISAIVKILELEEERQNNKEED